MMTRHKAICAPTFRDISDRIFKGPYVREKLSFFFIFMSVYLELGNDHLLPYPFQFVIHCHPITRRYKYLI